MKTPIPFDVEKGSKDELQLIKAAEARRRELNFKKNLGAISDEEYTRLMAATYQAEKQ